MNYKNHIAKKLNVQALDVELLESYIEIPPNTEMGDYALPCFKFAKALRKAPVMIANELCEKFVCDDVISHVEAVNGYLNFKINREGLVKESLARILKEGEAYGSAKIGEDKTVCIDYSSINIAKPFHIGHLSTTVIGGALYRIFKFLGYNTVGINHLGDYGTQFGKLIYAYKHWGNQKDVE